MASLFVSTVESNLPLILRILAALRLTGRLHVVQDRWTGEVCFTQGHIVAVAFGAERGLPALEAILLAVPDGLCTFSEGAPPATPNIELSTRALVALLRRLPPQQAQLTSVVPSLRAVPRAREPQTPWGFGEAISLPGSALVTLGAIDGRHCVAEVCGERGLARTVQDLVMLVDLGLITIEGPTSHPHPLAIILRGLHLGRRRDSLRATTGRPRRLADAAGEWSGALRSRARNGYEPVQTITASAVTRALRFPTRPWVQDPAAPAATAASTAPAPLTESARPRVGSESTRDPGDTGGPAHSDKLDRDARHGRASPKQSTAGQREQSRVTGSIWVLLALSVCLAGWALVAQVAPRILRGGSVQEDSRIGGSAPSVLRPILEDRFASDPGPWPNDPQSTAWAADGVYRLVVRQPGQFVALGRPLTETYRDVVVSTTVRKLGGPGGSEYGLIVRDQGPGPRDGSNQTGRFYVLRANDRGEANVAWREGDHWVELVPWTPSDAIHRGNTVNELAALAIGSRLGLMVNGSLIASAEDSAVAAGAVGLYVGGDSTEVAFETFRIEVPS